MTNYNPVCSKPSSPQESQLEKPNSGRNRQTEKHKFFIFVYKGILYQFVVNHSIREKVFLKNKDSSQYIFRSHKVINHIHQFIQFQVDPVDLDEVIKFSIRILSVVFLSVEWYFLRLSETYICLESSFYESS